MTTETPGQLITLIAGEVISAANQYRFVRMEADGKVDLAGASVGEDGLGIVQTLATAEDEAVTVMVSGVSKALVGTGGVSAGDLVQAINDGVIAATNGDFVVGQALDDGLVTELVRVLIGSRHLNIA